MEALLSFLTQLEEEKIYFKLNRIRDGILVEIAVPGERWEVEFMENGEVVIEVFTTTGSLLGGEALQTLFSKFSK